MFRRLLPFLSILLSPSLEAALIVIDTFSGSYLNRDIEHEGGTLNIRVTGDVNDTFLSTTTGNAAASAFHKSAILLADSDSNTTDLRLTFSAAVTGLSVTFTDVDADATPTFANLTPNDLLIGTEYEGLARAVGSGGNSPTVPSGWRAPNLNVVGQLIKANNTGTSAIVRFEFDSPQTFVRINYQNGSGGGGTGGVGITEIRFETIPEPASALLVALGTISLLRRRR
jgi:hypothetical protein